MAPKLLKDSLVEFFATSSRLIDAYRHAARSSKKLARGASIHKLGPTSGSAKVHSPGEYQPVVLSHADDDPHLLADARVQPMVAKAFHLLFTEPSTHPDQVAHWMRATNIRAEHRLQVVRVESLQTPQVSELLGRVCTALGSDGQRGHIIDAYLSGSTLLVRGPKHRLLSVPLSWVPAFSGQPATVLQNFKIDVDGSYLYWPELDVHLGWNQFLQIVEPDEMRKTLQRNSEFNNRYGAAIRKTREAAGIAQSDVRGLTDRQIRRIEHGECRATPSALQSLAAAHGLDLNDYLNQLAQQTSAPA